MRHLCCRAVCGPLRGSVALAAAPQRHNQKHQTFDNIIHTRIQPPVLRALRLALPFTKMPSNGLMGHGEPRPTEEARSVPSN